MTIKFENGILNHLHTPDNYHLYPMTEVDASVWNKCTLWKKTYCFLSLKYLLSILSCTVEPWCFARTDDFISK